MQEQHGICRLNRIPCTGDANFLDLIVAVTQTGCVNHMHRHTLDLDGLLHLVARGPCDGRHNGQLGPRQRIEQGRFARIGLACNHDLDAFAQQRPLARALQHQMQGVLQGCQLPMRIGLAQEVNFFFRKVQRCLHQHAQVNQRITQGVDFLGKSA